VRLNQLTGRVSDTLEGRVINDLIVRPKVLVDPEVQWFVPEEHQKHLRPFPLVRSVRRSMRRGSRAHVSRMVHRRKTLPSIATHIAVQVPGQRPVRLPHPAFKAATTTDQ
jgi:hypothetical protein